MDEAHHPQVEKLARWGEWFLRRACLNVRDKGTWLVLTGPTGTGKTHVGRVVHRFFNDYAVDLSACRSWPARVPTCAFVDWPAAVRRMERDRTEEALADALDAEVLILDDVGAETDRFKTGFTADVLRQVLSACDGRFVLISTNYPEQEWKRKFDARVADRLDAAHVMDTSGIPSYRPKLKSAN